MSINICAVRRIEAGYRTTERAQWAEAAVTPHGSLGGKLTLAG